jgi:hypothetical protein
MVLITVAMGDLVMGVVVTAVLIAVVVVAVVAAAAVAAVVVMVMVLVTDLLVVVIMIVVQQEQDMAMVEMLLALDLVMVAAMVAQCMEVLMVHMGHTVVVPMEGVPMVPVHMEVAVWVVAWGVEHMVAPQVVMVPVDMALMGERAVLVVGVQVLGVPAGTTHMENK